MTSIESHVLILMIRVGRVLLHIAQCSNSVRALTAVDLRLRSKVYSWLYFDFENVAGWETLYCVSQCSKAFRSLGNHLGVLIANAESIQSGMLYRSVPKSISHFQCSSRWSRESGARDSSCCTSSHVPNHFRLLRMGSWSSFDPAPVALHDAQDPKLIREVALAARSDRVTEPYIWIFVRDPMLDTALACDSIFRQRSPM